MWFLWLFGDNVEDRLGHAKFLLFYLLGGVFASLVHTLVHPRSLIPTIGASGAVSAVLGAYFIGFPRARIVTLVPLFYFWQLVEIPAALYLLIWFFFQQLLPGLGTLAAGRAAGVAFWAHIGGFVAGAAYFWWRKKNAPRGPGIYVRYRLLR